MGDFQRAGINMGLYKVINFFSDVAPPSLYIG